jgi:hypothetical protein
MKNIVPVTRNRKSWGKDKRNSFIFLNRAILVVAQFEIL